MLAVAPGAARAVLVVVLPAGDADHAPYCATCVIVLLCGRFMGCLPQDGYTGFMPEKTEADVLPFPDRRAAGRLLAERLADSVALA